MNMAIFNKLDDGYSLFWCLHVKLILFINNNTIINNDDSSTYNNSSNNNNIKQIKNARFIISMDYFVFFILLPIFLLLQT